MIHDDREVTAFLSDTTYDTEEEEAVAAFSAKFKPVYGEFIESDDTAWCEIKTIVDMKAAMESYEQSDFYDLYVKFGKKAAADDDDAPPAKRARESDKQN